MSTPVAAVVELANVEFSIAAACRLVGVDMPDGVIMGKSVKVYCPFGTVHHLDGGVEKAMRVYPESNHAYCFAGCGFFPPVRLVAHAWGRPQAEVAHDLLDRAGIAPQTLLERFRAARDWMPDLDRSALAEALRTYCRRICPDWPQRRFDERVATAFNRCLELLGLVRDEEDVVLWLDSCKIAMTRALDVR